MRDAERSKVYVRRLAAAFGQCTAQASAYGACVRGQMEAVEVRACEPEFRALSKCFRSHLAKGKAA